MTTAEHAIDALMEEASGALVAMDYFKAERLCTRAIERARGSHDYERMARACLPLQEARRYIRQAALDAPDTVVLSSPADLPSPAPSGRYLLQPPSVGIDAGVLRATLARRRVPALVLVREPTTKDGLWPIVGVGTGEPLPVVLRVKVEPPKDDVPDARWFNTTHELLGEAAFAKVNPQWPAAHRVEDFWEYLAAVPEHERLIQALRAACLEALRPSRPVPARRRPQHDNPFSF